jgi:hypothetical protein
VLGPLVAFGMLAVAPLAFHSIFLVSFCVAIVGVSILVLLVDPRSTAPDGATPDRAPSLGGALALLRVSRYRSLVLAGGALSLATASDAFIFLALQRKLDLGTSLFPLMFVGSSAVYMLLAVPMGALADRIGAAASCSADTRCSWRSTPCCSPPPTGCSCSPERWGCSAPTTRPPTAC